MEGLSSHQLFEELGKFYAESTEEPGEDSIAPAFAILKAQKINGKRAISMSTVDFFNLGITYGDAMELKELISKVNDHLSSALNDKCNNSDEKGDSSDDDSDYDDIQPYFSPEVFKKMSNYEKLVHRNVKRRYESCKNLGVVDEPAFMQQNKKQKTVEKTSGDSSSSKQAQPSSSKPSSRSGLDHKSGKTAAKKVSEEHYAAQLPSYDITAILTACKGKAVRELENALKNLEENKPLSSKHTKLMIRTLVLAVFCDESGSYKPGVTSNEKEGLAASIVKLYPFFKDTSESKKFSWWRVFDRKLNRGRIPNVISNLQRKVEKAGPASSPCDSANDDEGDDSLNTGSVDDFLWLSLLVPNRGEHKQILTGMKDSFTVRKRWIRESRSTIHEILEKFPHLISYGGELVEEDFKMLYPQLNHSALLQRFPQFVSKLKSLETFAPLEDNLVNDDIQGCICIAEKMPWQNLKRFGSATRREKLILENLVVIIPGGTDVRNIIEERRTKSNSSVQPYLIVFIPATTITKLFAVADNRTIEVESKSFVKGLDILFKMYHIFDVEYPRSWSRFFQFLEYGFYNLNPSKLTNLMKDFMTRVNTASVN